MNEPTEMKPCPKEWQSCALWPKDTVSEPDNITRDDHYTEGEAKGVCQLLERNGFGGGRVVFPIRTWVDRSATSPLATPEPPGSAATQGYEGRCPTCSSDNIPHAGTPRVDAEIYTAFEADVAITCVDADFARTLERELTASQAEVARVKEERDEVKRYAERLRGSINGSGPRDVDYMIALEKDLTSTRALLCAERATVSRLTGERDEAVATLAQITPLKNSDIRLVIKLTTERDEARAKSEAGWTRAEEKHADLIAALAEVEALRRDKEAKGWQPIETAPKNGEQRIIIAQFRDSELLNIDFDAVYEKESESWEIPQEYYVWKSALGLVEEPTHWMPLPALTPPEANGKGES